MTAGHPLLPLLVPVLLFAVTCSASTCGSTACEAKLPNVAVWSIPRSGSCLFLNSLGSPGYWGENIYLEPFLLTGLPMFFGAPHEQLANATQTTTAPELFELMKAKGPFVFKEHSATLFRYGGSPSKIPYLRDPKLRHILLFRHPKYSGRSLYTTSFKAKITATLTPIFTHPLLAAGYDPADFNDLMDDYASLRYHYILYRYLTEVLGMKDNILLVDIDHVWADPRAAMQQVAEFLDVPFSEKFLSWDGMTYPIPEVFKDYFHVIKNTKGFVKRDEANSGDLKMTKSSELFDLPDDWLAAYVKSIGKNEKYYKWLSEETPEEHRLKTPKKEE
eukprot:m.89613 g.89613  ORF g.89613 m.89613 type:complete len:332 (+) comp21530_c0_seq1:128-1123(+)